ncbi:hypothetical protein GCM10010973_33850 [Cribrihabitans marinus]|nr:hypothetical protein GCM10010973_33850 [Cribrihabitans marinus]
MRGRGTAASRAKAATPKRDLGKEKTGHLDRQALIDYGKKSMVSSTVMCG